ncbi:MAG: insulinase family protein [Myxococcales bacterium]|nr:insulinase family protein [Myxococcales bacterium]
MSPTRTKRRLGANGRASFRVRGVQVLVESSDDLPLVEVEIGLRGGSLADPAGREGLASLTARAMALGPKGRSARTFEEQVAVLGGRLGASVGLGTLRLRGSVIRRNVEPFVDLLSAATLAPALRGSDIAQLKREVLAELVAARDDDHELAGTWFRRALYADHPYGRPAAGEVTSVRQVSGRDVAAYHRAALVRSNTVIGFAGDIDAAEARRLVERAFAGLPEGRFELPRVPPTRARPGRHVLLVDKPDRAQTQLFIGTLGSRARDPLLDPLVVANAAFGGTFTSRLMQAIRAERGWSYGATSRLTHHARRSAWWMWTFPAARYAAECAATQLELLDAWVAAGVSADEVRFAKRALVNSRCFDIDTASKRLAARMDVELLRLPRDFHEGYVHRVKTVRRHAANEAVARRIRPRDLAIVAVGGAERLRAGFEALPGVATVTVVPFDASG